MHLSMGAPLSHSHRAMCSILMPRWHKHVILLAQSVADGTNPRLGSSSQLVALVLAHAGPLSDRP